MKDSFNDLTLQELHKKQEELNREYRDIRFNMVIGHVDNPLKKRTVRRKLTRVNTLIHEYELGIRKEIKKQEIKKQEKKQE
jgi:large subunit ribosomal protein L29